MKDKVYAIAPELHGSIYGTPQKTRVYFQDLHELTLEINDREYIYALQPADTIVDVMLGFKDLIDNDPAPIATVVNVNENDVYFDLRGVLTDPFTVNPMNNTLIIPPIPTELWDILWEDVEEQVNEDNMVGEVERCQRYFMAHLLTRHAEQTIAAGASSQTVDRVSVTYANPLDDLTLTRYGLLAREIWLRNRRIRYT